MSNELRVRMSPGMSSFSANPDGTYDHTGCVLGGSIGAGTVNADYVAQFLAKRVEMPAENLQKLEALGWNDVIGKYRELLDQQAHEKRLRRVEQLRKDIAYADPLYQESRHTDFRYWTERIYDNWAANPDFGPEEFSARRLKYAAESAMAFIRTLPKMKAELCHLCQELGIPVNADAT